MTYKFKRKRFLLSEKNKKSKFIGYARATDSEFDYLDEQIKSLKNEGCSLIFSEIISIDEAIKPELKKALNYLSKRDELIVTKLDRAFSNRSECIKTINKLLNNDVKLRTLSGFLSPKNSSEISSSVFNITFWFNLIFELHILFTNNGIASVTIIHIAVTTLSTAIVPA